MSSEFAPDTIETHPPLPQDDFSDSLPVLELEPMADGARRALVYPDDRSGGELATRWLAAPESLLVDVDDVR